ncbi:MAG: hypothetical protein CMJ49_11190 [Planctomycetaceae bacterium]|nr:hypothetical protein [Planctomycetaceae bacterium]
MTDDAHKSSADALESMLDGEPADVDDSIQDAPAVSDQEPTRTGSPRSAGARRRSNDLKRTAVPILITVGVLLLIPGFWALAVLAGLSVPLADQGDADTMAWVFLCCLPISAILLVGAVVFYQQNRSDG